MTFKKLNQKGFSAVEALLIVIILAILGGTGYYVYHANSKATDNQNKAQTDANTAAPHKKNAKSAKSSSKQKYLTVTQWGVRFPYSGSDTYTYRPNDDPSSISVVSANLSAKYGCDSFGAGLIGRFKADERINTDGSGPTATQAAASDPSAWGHVGDYYFQFHPDQAACANKPTDASAAAQHEAWNAVGLIVPKAEAIP